MKLKLCNDNYNYWISGDSYFSMINSQQFINYFFPFIETLSINQNTKIKSDLFLYGSQLESNKQLNSNNINILLSVENPYQWKNKWHPYLHYRNYRDFNNSKISIYLYNHFNKVILTKQFIMIPIIYLQITYFNNNYSNIKPSITIPFNQKKFCLIVSPPKDDSTCKLKHFIIKFLKSIGECDEISLYKPILHNKSCYHSQELLNVCNKYKFIFASENSLQNGYITEKIFNVFFSRCIPLYCGPNDTYRYFNSKCFFKMNNLKLLPYYKKQITLLNNNEKLFNLIINQPKINKRFNNENYILKAKQFLQYKFNK